MTRRNLAVSIELNGVRGKVGVARETNESHTLVDLKNILIEHLGSLNVQREDSRSTLIRDVKEVLQQQLCQDIDRGNIAVETDLETPGDDERVRRSLPLKQGVRRDGR